MANEKRGEFDITIGEEEITLVPSYENFTEIEHATGRCLMNMTFQISQNALPMSEVVKTIEILSGKKELGAKIFEFGYLEVMQQLGPFLIKGIAGGAVGKDKTEGK